VASILAAAPAASHHNLKPIRARADALYLSAIGFRNLGQLDDAIQALDDVLAMQSDEAFGRQIQAIREQIEDLIQPVP